MHRAGRSLWTAGSPGFWLVLTIVALSAAPAMVAAQTSNGGGARFASSAALRPGDVVRVTIWREPDLSGEFFVDEGGRVVLPRLGRMDVAGMRPEDLKDQIFNGYREFLSHSSIEITFLRRVQVLGAVRSPGLYTVDPTLTISDVIALAGGITPQGRPDRVEIVRFGNRIAQLSIRERVAESVLQSGDQIYVEERSWLSRNPGVALGAVGTIASLVIALIR